MGQEDCPIKGFTIVPIYFDGAVDPTVVVIPSPTIVIWRHLSDYCILETPVLFNPSRPTIDFVSRLRRDLFDFHFTKRSNMTSTHLTFL